MNKKKSDINKAFTHPRWNEPIGGKVIGNEPLTEEKEKQAHTDTLSVLKSMGVKIKNKE